MPLTVRVHLPSVRGQLAAAAERQSVPERRWAGCAFSILKSTSSTADSKVFSPNRQASRNQISDGERFAHASQAVALGCSRSVQASFGAVATNDRRQPVERLHDRASPSVRMALFLDGIDAVFLDVAATIP